MRENIKVLFMGTPEFAQESLKALVESGYQVVGVFTNPDKPSGRGMKLTPSPVKVYAQENKIPVYQPAKVRKNEQVMEILQQLKPDVIAVVAYGKILPKEILEYPKYGCINVHGSILPKYRGAAPMQWAIINGEKKTGITTMLMDEGMDTGDMLLKQEINITNTDTYETIHNTLKKIGATLLVETLDLLVKDGITPQKQPEGATNAPMISKEMTKINFNQSAEMVDCFVRGLSPQPGTYMESNSGVKYKVYQVKPIKNFEEKEAKVGEVIFVSKDTLTIKCATGNINILEIQPPNSKRMPIQSFLQGNRIVTGEIFNERKE